VHLVGSTIEIYYDAQSYKSQISQRCVYYKTYLLTFAGTDYFVHAVIIPIFFGTKLQ